MLIDTHSHTYYSEDKDAENILKECEENNIKIILNGIDKSSNKEVIELSKKFSNVYAAIGYDHPVVDSIKEEDIKLLEKQIKEEKIIAIGEIGLDYYWIKDNKEKQKKLFIKQLDFMPVLIGVIYGFNFWLGLLFNDYSNLRKIGLNEYHQPIINNSEDNI